MWNRKWSFVDHHLVSYCDPRSFYSPCTSSKHNFGATLIHPLLHPVFIPKHDWLQVDHSSVEFSNYLDHCINKYYFDMKHAPAIFVSSESTDALSSGNKHMPIVINNKMAPNSEINPGLIRNANFLPKMSHAKRDHIFECFERSLANFNEAVADTEYLQWS